MRGTPINVKPLSKARQWFSVLVVSFGGVGLGISLAWTATALPSIQETQQIGHDLSATEKSLIGSLLTCGALIACPFTALGMNVFGRKSCTIWLSILAIPGWVLLAGASTSLHLYVGRVLTGIYAGGCTVVVPVYVKELASTENRGVLGTFFLIMLCIGKLISNVVGILFSASMASLLCALQPLIHGLFLLIIPESPIYEKRKNASKRNDEFNGNNSPFDRIGSVGNGHDETKDGNAIANQQKLNDNTKMIYANNIAPIVTVFVLILLAQICGINVVTFFTNEMLEGDTFATLIDPKLALVLMSAIQVIGGFPSSFLVDKCGRKGLLISSFVAMTIAMGTLSAYYFYLNPNSADYPKMLALIPLASLSVYSLAYSWGVGSIIWIVISEIIPSEIIHVISPLANVLYWSAAFLITFLFQLLSTDVPLYIWFIGFSLVSIGGALFVALLLPETKGLCFEDIQKRYQKGFHFKRITKM